MGMTPGSTGMNFLKGGLTGLSQGLANYNNPHPVYDFSGLAQGFQSKQQPLVRDMSNSVNKPSRIPKPDTGDDDASQPNQIGAQDPLANLRKLFPPQNYNAPGFDPNP
jgi:hypothetical protein